MPELVKKINKWSKIRPVYWSMMKAAQYEVGHREYLYPGIFGKKINDIGLTEAVELFDTNSYGHPDSVKVNHTRKLGSFRKDSFYKNKDNTISEMIKTLKQYNIKKYDKKVFYGYKSLEWANKI